MKKERYLDFNNQEEGFRSISVSELTKEFIKQNQGREICYVLRSRIDPYRGYYSVVRGKLFDRHYSRLFLDSAENEADLRDIQEIGIRKTKTENEVRIN